MRMTSYGLEPSSHSAPNMSSIFCLPTKNRLTLQPVSREGLGPVTKTRSISRSAARLAAVQALYQQEMEGTPTARLLHEFHDHRLGATIEGETYADAEISFFDDLVSGALARRDEIDSLIAERLAEGWTLERLDKPMKAILRVGVYELLARADVPVASVISEYVDVADAFYDAREKGFVNGLLDAIAKVARSA